MKLQLIEKGYLCPVDNVIVDVTFKGYSPRINGYIGKENFDRFKVATTFEYPCFPFKSTELDDKKIAAWIDGNLSSQKEHGVYTGLHERVYAQNRFLFLLSILHSNLVKIWINMRRSSMRDI